jgi:hypothetical protein
MIRPIDCFYMSLHKLALRKKRAIFAIISTALGVIVVVCASSLIVGVRKAVQKTMQTDDIPEKTIIVQAIDDRRMYDDPFGEVQKPKRHQFLDEELFAEMRTWPGVLAADRIIWIRPVSIDVLVEHPNPLSWLKGVPWPVMEQMSVNQPRVDDDDQTVPIVVGRSRLQFHYDAATDKMQYAKEFDAAEWIGKEVTIRLGDNYAQIDKFDYDYETKEFVRLDQDVLSSMKDGISRGNARKFNTLLYNTVLSFKGRIVGVCEGSDVVIPIEVAALFEKWLASRHALALLEDEEQEPVPSYSSFGRSTPREGEYSAGMLAVNSLVRTEAIADRLDKMGFRVETRKRALEEQSKEFESGVRVVKRVAFIFGGVILGLACALLASTIAKIISDSRADIGLFRALGATKNDVRWLFLGESGLMGVCGTIVGTLLGWALAGGISLWVISYAHRESTSPQEKLLIPDSIFGIDLPFCILLLLGSVVVSVLAGWLPARKATRIDPVDALRRT